jgi:putative membrane-bound dehydrogenase-like protein
MSRFALSALAVAGLLFLSKSPAQLPPPDGVAALVPGEGLQVQLFAHEPQLYCPTAFDIDEKGRVWVTEGVNYRRAAGPKTPEPPYYLTPHRKTGDRIVVLEDTDGNGRCDRSRVFAEGLDIKSPQGFAVIGDRVWISQSPNITTIEIKPDGTAGEKKVILTGFNGIHSDHSVHSLTLGPDGRLYSCFGDTGCDTRFPDGRRLVTNGKPWRGGCAFRMNFDLTGAEIIAHNFRNGYEVAVDSFGNAFKSDNDEDDGNQFCRLVYLMEGGNYGWNPYQKGFDWNLEQPGVVPILMRTGAGAPAGLCVYEGKLLPEKYRGMPVLAECGAGWVGCFRLSADGAGFRVAGAAVSPDGRQTIDNLREIRKPDMLLSSSDRWFRPCDVAVAPDGSLFVADFYNHIAGGRDLNQPWRGRIYRLLPKGHDGSYRIPAIDVAKPEGLVAALGSPNLAARARAILRVKELGPAAVDILAPHVKSADRVLRARVLFQLGTLGSEGQKHVRAALQDDDSDIRIVAIRSLRPNGADMVDVAKSLQQDRSAQVRRELLLSLRDSDPAAARDVLVALANQYDGQDRYYLEAVGIAFRGRESALTPALIQSWKKDEWNRRVAGLLWVLGPPEAIPTFAAVAGDRQRLPADRRIAIEALGPLNDARAGEALAKLLVEDNSRELVRQALPLLTRKAAGPWRSLSRQPELLAAVERLVKDPELGREALALSRALGTRPLAQWMLSQPFASSKGSGFDKAYPPESADKPELSSDWTRGRANPDGIIDLAWQRSPRTDVLAYAATLVNAKEAFATRLWIGSSASLRVWVNGKLVHETKGPREVAARQEAVAVSLTAGVNRLLVKSDAGPKEWGFIVELEDPLGRVAEVTDQSLPKISAPPSERLDPKKLPPDRELLALKGDPGRGRQVFLRSKANCASCHQIKGEGGVMGVGPALDGIGVKMSREALLAELLRPSQSILQQYYAWTVETKAGVIATGIVVEDMPDRVVLKDAQGKATTIDKKDIAQRSRSDVSLMPELLVGELTRQDLADLLQYLADLK